MPTDLINVWTFFDNRDAYTQFLHRVEAAVVEKAKALRSESPPSPVTAAWFYRQQWANAALGGPTGAQAKAVQMLPTLAVTANDAGYLEANGTIVVTDTQIRAVLSDAFVDLFAGYIPEVG